MDLVFKNNLILYIQGYIDYLKKSNLDLSDGVAVEEYCISLYRLYGALRDYQTKYLIFN